MSAAEFNATYAPTAAQEQIVVGELQAAGFSVTQRFSNRTIVDASAPNAAVERYFHTEMHDVTQGRYGTHFMNKTPATVPATIAPLIRQISLNDLVVAKTQLDGKTLGQHGPKSPGNRSTQSVEADASQRVQISPEAGCTGQLLLNPGFESGNVSWSTTSGVITNSSANAYAGSWFAWLDGYTSPETDTLQQTVAIPAGCNATLTYELYVASNETSGSPIDTLALTVNGATQQSFSNLTTTGGAYVKQTVNLNSFAGKNATILYTSHQTGSAETDFFADSAAVTLSGGTPTPTSAPTATPTPKPTATPTARPSATPTATPTATPAPTPTPTATPANCNGAAPLNGPLSNGNGTLATGVAKAFDFPVQHGCSGSGQTAAIIIDSSANISDLNNYLSAAGVSHTGSVTSIAVDGGGSGNDPETALDVESIAGRAPAANIRVYHIPSLSDQSIEDAYNKAITDGLASVVNSSFGGYASADPSFATATNSIAQQGAAMGVTFVASSGDTGSNECSGSLGNSAPADDPYFVSVGGVNFTQNSSGTLTSLTAQGDGTTFQSGGGVSSVFAEPSYQSGVAVSTSGRNQPDLSLPGAGVAVYVTPGTGKYDGTSWSSPCFVAPMLEANQIHATKFGWVNPTIYTLYKNTGFTNYTDVTSGNNGAYNALTGYDLVTGIGTPKGYAFASAL